MRIACGLVSLTVLAACTTSDDRWYGGDSADVANDPAALRLVSDRLETFTSEADFKRYLESVQAVAKAKGLWWAGEGLQYASLDQPPAATPCNPQIEDCDGEDRVVITGSRISAPQATSAVTAVTADSSGTADTITNVQKAGVDEGDIVKRIGKHLVVLQDGRLFSVDMEALKLSDRKDVYAPSTRGAWYDEILVTGRRVLVTGFNYREQATQLTVFAMDEAGKFSPEGTFFLSSNDYYDSENYATRLVGEKLVIYSPLYLSDAYPWTSITWPMVRRWTDTPLTESEAKPLFDARDIYKPIQPTLSPVVHSLSVCDLGVEAMRRNLECKTTAIVGPDARTFYVSPDDVYLWLATTDDYGADACKTANHLRVEDGVPASVFRIPLAGGKPKVMQARGMPRDQFAMDTSSGEFRALVHWGWSGCNDDERGQTQVRYFSAPLSGFRSGVRETAGWRFKTAPAPGGGDYENRFSDTHVVYGSRENYWGGAPHEDDEPMEANLVAVPVNHSQPTVLKAPHGINRIERVGDRMVATGYRDAAGLSVSMVELADTPQITDTLVLVDRYESEGRSHAFNARPGANGGLMGIPTVPRVSDSRRYYWRSDASDVSFMAYNGTGQISDIGMLTVSESAKLPGYKCEVSCIDWYGNARPIFIGDRLFALTGTEIVEGRVAEGQVIETRRVNLTAPLE